MRRPTAVVLKAKRFPALATFQQLNSSGLSLFRCVFSFRNVPFNEGQILTASELVWHPELHISICKVCTMLNRHCFAEISNAFPEEDVWMAANVAPKPGYIIQHRWGLHICEWRHRGYNFYLFIYFYHACWTCFLTRMCSHLFFFLTLPTYQLTPSLPPDRWR